jgi:hypothetical protein
MSTITSKIFIAISSILFVSSIIGLVMIILKFKETNNLLEDYMKANPKPFYNDDKEYNKIGKKSNLYMGLIILMLFIIFIMIAAVIMSISNYRELITM